MSTGDPADVDDTPGAGPPTILVVDDDPAALGRTEGELVRRSGADYRIVACTGPGDGLRELDALRARGGELAIALADLWMPELDGMELLARVAEAFPRAKRGVLIDYGGWGDEPTARAVLRAMAVGGMDYYVLKPWRSPDELFNRTIAEFLHEWSRQRATGPREVTVIGPPDDPRTHVVVDLLSRNAVPHVVRPADGADGRALLARAGLDACRAPIVGLHDGRVLVDPSKVELAQALGFTTSLPGTDFDVVIVGAGPAGLAAAVYAASEGLETLVVERESIGGQAGSSSLIRNYLGFPRGISGAELATRAHQQAWVFGATFLMMREVVGFQPDGDRIAVAISDGSTARTSALVLAMGVAYRQLGVPGLEALTGAGVFYGASIAEAQALEGEEVYVLGGGNSAGQAAMHLARYAGRVTILVRGATLAASMSQYLIRQIDAAPNIEVRFGTEVVGGGGRGRLEELVLRERAGGTIRRVPAAGLFVMIGARPHTEWLPAGVARDDWGFLLTGEDAAGRATPGHSPSRFETSMPRVFAAGDVRHGATKRVGSAVGEGAGVVQDLHRLVTQPAGV